MATVAVPNSALQTAVDSALTGLAAASVATPADVALIAYTISYMTQVSSTAAAVIAAYPSITNPTAADNFNKANADAMKDFAAVAAKLPAALERVIAQAKTAAETLATTS